MDAVLYFKVLTIYTSIWRMSADMQILVTKDQCGRSIELEPHNIVTLEYTGEDVGDIYSQCVIDFVNNVEDDMTCIRTNSSNRFSVNCITLLEYYPQGNSADYNAKAHSCMAFSYYPLCEKSSRSSVVYRNSFGSNKPLKVWVYTEKYEYKPTTTSSPWSPWTSWSSWSSSSGGYDDKDDDENSTGMVVGLTVGIVAIVVFVAICCAACQKKSQAPKPIYGPPVVVQLTTQNNQPQYPGAQPNTVVVQNQYTPDPSQFPGYQVHAPVYQSVPKQSMPVGDQLNQNYPEPSAPPPPYHGN